MSVFYNFLITEFWEILRLLFIIFPLSMFFYVIFRDIHRDMEEENKSKAKIKKKK